MITVIGVLNEEDGQWGVGGLVIMGDSDDGGAVMIGQ